jgi:hypothetical protein
MAPIGKAFLLSLAILLVPQIAILLLQLLSPGPTEVTGWIMGRVFEVSLNAVGWLWIALAVRGVYRWLKKPKPE